MSTTAVVVIVVAVVLLIVIGVMVGLNKRKKRPATRSSPSRYREEYGPTEEAAAENYRDPVVEAADAGEWPPLPQRDPEPRWSSPPPFSAPPQSRTPMIRRGEHERDEDEPARRRELQGDWREDTPPTDVPDPGAWDPWETHRNDGPSVRTVADAYDQGRAESQPASFRDDSPSSGSSGGGWGGSSGSSSGTDSGSSGGSSGGDSGSSSSSGGGCD